MGNDNCHSPTYKLATLTCRGRTLSKVGVIGRLSFLAGFPWVALVRFIPARTRLSTGRLDWSRESGRPSANCIFRTADRYDFIVCGASPQLAIAAAN